MKEQIESVTLEGTTLKIALRPPLPAEAAALAAAIAKRAFERYPVLSEVVVAAAGVEHRLSREPVGGGAGSGG